MSDAPKDDSPAEDVQRLAKEYVDLWEGQFKALAGDEALARTMAQTMELMNAGAANVAAMMQRAASSSTEGMDFKGAADDSSGAGQNDPSSGTGTASSGVAPGRSEPDVRELTRRVAKLEERLARLEGLSEPTGKVAPKKPRKG